MKTLLFRLVYSVLLLLAAANAFTAPKPQKSQPPVVAREWPRMAVSDGGPATLEKPKVVEDKKQQSAGTKMPAWEIRLWTDPYNKREFVARCLAEVCGKSDTESYQIMMQAHKNGMGVVGRYDFEIAELYNKSLKDNGLLVDMIPVDDE